MGGRQQDYPPCSLCGLVPEDPVEGRLGGDAVSRLGMQGIRSPRPTRTWHQRVECHRAWARESASFRGAPLGGRTCLAGMPWRTRIPTPPPAGASQMPPSPGILGEPPRMPATPKPRLGRASLAVCEAVAQMRSTTSTHHSATVCQCRHRDVALACATRNSPGWGSTSPHRSSRRGGRFRRQPTEAGGGVEPRSPQRGGGGGWGGAPGPPTNSTAVGQRT